MPDRLKVTAAPLEDLVRRGDNRTDADWLYALLCSACLVVCVLIAHPFANIAFDDDWSYAAVALKFSQTGRMQYNGWSSPLLLFQTIWAFPWIRSFGFSFDLLRYITLPFSAGFVYLSFLTARSAGLRRDTALFGGLIIATSPLFVPLAATFMTEPYACFFGSLAIYAALRSVKSAARNSAVFWLFVLGIAGLIGGTDRQVVWITPIFLIPWLAWPRRDDRRFTCLAAMVYCGCVIAIAAVIYFFNQPYAPLELTRSQLYSLIAQNLIPSAGIMVSLLLAGVSLTLPAFFSLIPAWRILGVRTLAALLMGATLLAVLIFEIAPASPFRMGIFPYVANIISKRGILDGIMLGMHPGKMTAEFRAFMTMVVNFSLLSFVWLMVGQKGIRKNLRHNPAYPVFAIVFLSYLALLLPGALIGITFDRYVLPLMPLIAIVILHEFQRFRRKIPKPAWACLIIFGIYAVATTHDYAANLRAREAIAEALIARGIPRDHVSGGVEYDGWIQLQEAGYITGARYGDLLTHHEGCWHWFWSKATSLTPEYVEIFGLPSTAGGPGLPRAEFPVWLPPFRESIIVWKRSSLDKYCEPALTRLQAE